MIKLITAYDPNKLIGKGNYLPWRIKEEFDHFRRFTLNKTILMGQNTFDGIGKPLPDRKTIILTLDENYKYEHKDVSISHEFKAIVDKYKGNKEQDIIICGGKTIYKLFLPYVDEMVISHIRKEYEGDVYFPEWDESQFFVEDIQNFKDFFVKTYKRIGK